MIMDKHTARAAAYIVGAVAVGVALAVVPPTRDLFAELGRALWSALAWTMTLVAEHAVWLVVVAAVVGVAVWLVDRRARVGRDRLAEHDDEHDDEHRAG